MRLANAALRFLFAPQCAACEGDLPRPLDGPVCDECWRAVASMTPPWCARCGDALASAALALCTRCAADPPDFAVARSAGRYEGSLRAIVHALKYGKCRAIAPRLAAAMQGAGAELLEAAGAVVPVPLHPWRRVSRGFNQADDLARLLGKPVARVLRRRRHGPPQASLPASRRALSVRDAFGLKLGAARLVRGRALLVVDDVMTTGATMNACSRVLLDAGARAVYALTAARAVAGRTAPPPPPPHPSNARRR
jgi:ComF family protein